MQELNLCLSNITKAYGEKILFQNLSASFTSGTISVIKGLNGSGKSTLLNIIAALTPPDSGSISLIDKATNKAITPITPFTGMTAPDMGLYAKLSALEHLELFARLVSSYRKLSASEYQAYLEAVGFSNIHSLAGELSTGMRQRLKLAIMLMADRPLALLDEPTSNLDSEGKALTHSLIARMKNEGKIVILATNDTKEESLADEILCLS